MSLGQVAATLGCPRKGRMDEQDSALLQLIPLLQLDGCGSRRESDRGRQRTDGAPSHASPHIKRSELSYAAMRRYGPNSVRNTSLPVKLWRPAKSVSTVFARRVACWAFRRIEPCPTLRRIPRTSTAHDSPTCPGLGRSSSSPSTSSRGAIRQE